MQFMRIGMVLLLIATCLLVTADQPSTSACAGSGSSGCVVSETACLKSMVMAKAVASTVVVPAGLPGTFNAEVELYIRCPQADNCGALCENSPDPMSASLSISLFPKGATTPLPAPTAAGTISTVAGTMTLPGCDRGLPPVASILTTGTVNSSLAPIPPPGFNPYTVPVSIPVGTPAGEYQVIGNATVTFEDGMTLTATGDTLVCLVGEAPGQPGLPRLDMQLLTETFPRVAPGDQAVSEYRITNRDPLRSVSLTAFADSQQIAIRPKGGNEQQGVFAIANSFGDDFPVMFDPTACIPLPEHPFTQGEISKVLPALAPGQSTIVRVGIRPYGQCGTGSCSESTFRVVGTFSDGTSAQACAGIAVYVSTGIMPQSCGLTEFDCNRNGIADAEDIFNGSSADRNFNALPDECEQGAPAITEPVQVTPLVAVAGRPIRVSVMTTGQSPITSVLVNNVNLTSNDGRLWQGDIIAAQDVGPQTVYALAKDARGQLATHLGVYRTRALLAQDLRCHIICFHAPGYYVANLAGLAATNQFTRNTVVIPGANFNYPVFIDDNVPQLRWVLQAGAFGRPTPFNRFSQAFVTAQLNLALRSSSSFSVLRGQLGCYSQLEDFTLVRLSNGILLTSESRLGDLFDQALLALRERRNGDLETLTGIFELLNGNDSSGLCR